MAEDYDLYGVHVTHCCPVHGCKYAKDGDCPILMGTVTPAYRRNNGCEQCEDDEREINAATRVDRDYGMREALKKRGLPPEADAEGLARHERGQGLFMGAMHQDARGFARELSVLAIRMEKTGAVEITTNESAADFVREYRDSKVRSTPPDLHGVPTGEQILKHLAARLSDAITGVESGANDEYDWDSVGRVMRDLRRLANGESIQFTREWKT